MSDLENPRNVEKNEKPNAGLEGNTELKENQEKGLEQLAQNGDQLSDEELNQPIDGPATNVRASLDCRSECQYNTGERYKYANYGYSG